MAEPTPPPPSPHEKVARSALETYGYRTGGLDRAAVDRLTAALGPSDGSDMPTDPADTLQQLGGNPDRGAAAPARPPPDFWTHADKAMFGVCEMLALLFGLPFGEDLYNDKPVTGWHSFYLAIALVFAVAGPMWPWIRTRSWVSQALVVRLSSAVVSPYAWLAALLALFFYGTGPELYRRATAPFASTLTAQDLAGAVTNAIRPELEALKQANVSPKPVSPSAQEIATALTPAIRSELNEIRQALNAAPPQVPTIAAPPETPYVNPIHDDASKWKVAHEIRRYYPLGIRECHIVIVRYQTEYAEAYAADLKDLLNTVGWPVEERFAASTLERGMSIRAIRGGTTSQCSSLLTNSLRGYARPRLSGGQIPVAPSEIADAAKAPDYLKECGANCIEVSIGLEAQ